MSLKVPLKEELREKTNMQKGTLCRGWGRGGGIVGCVVRVEAVVLIESRFRPSFVLECPSQFRDSTNPILGSRCLETDFELNKNDVHLQFLNF